MMFSKILAACALTVSSTMANEVLVMKPLSGTSGGAPGSSVSFGPLANGASAWADVPGAKFQNVPAFLEQATYVAFTQTLPAGDLVRFVCTDSECDAYVFLYECGTCPSQKGNLPMELLAAGWERTRCAPDFVRGSMMYNHRMVSYRKRVSTLNTDLQLTGDLEYAMFAVQAPTIECSGLTPAQCVAPATKNFCYWMGDCMTNRCMPKGAGGGPSCPKCASDDI